MKKVLTYLAIVLIAAANALNYELFVFPNSFAPSGLNGLCTMFQYLTGVSMGYLSLLLNLPLAIAVYCKVSKTLAIRAMTYVAVFSVMLVVLGRLDLSAIAYSTDFSPILGPVAGGSIGGGCRAVLTKAGSYCGGTDFASSLILKRRPDWNFYWIGFSLNVGVALLSFFVYGCRIEPVLLCILYCFSYSTVTSAMSKSNRSAVRFEIITEHPERLRQTITEQLHHSATVVPGRGIYAGRQTNVIICVVNRTQEHALAELIRRTPGTFAIVDQVSDVVGRFVRISGSGKEEQPIFDDGDGTGIE